MRVALGIRGHIRDGLTDSGLRNFVKTLSNLRQVTSLSIHCHTWSETEANLSYRKLGASYGLQVNEPLLRHYFGDECSSLVKTVSVDSEADVKIKGRTDGYVGLTQMPVLGWKRMWEGKKRLVDSIVTYDNYDMIINTRYDLFTHHICKKTPETVLLRLVRGRYTLNFKYPAYTRGAVGVDNFYTGNPYSMKALTDAFSENLDEILDTYPSVKIQEEIVYHYANAKGLILG